MSCFPKRALGRPSADRRGAHCAPAGVILGAVTSESLSAGTLIDSRYRLGARLTDDGPGEVYEAEQVRASRPATVRVFPAGAKPDPAAKERFLAAAGAIARLDHAGLVRLLDFGWHGDRAYLAHDRASGQPLDDILTSRAPLPLEEALSILWQIAEALDQALASGQVHGGLSARRVHLAEGKIALASYGVIPLGAILGIQAPRATSGPGSPAAGTGASDLEALGALAHRMMYGQAPGASSATSVSPPPHPALASLVDRLIGQGPQPRCATTQALLEGLRGVAAQIPLPDVSEQAELLKSGSVPTSPTVIPPPPPDVSQPTAARSPLQGGGAAPGASGPASPASPARPAPPPAPAGSAPARPAKEAPKQELSLSMDLPAFFRKENQSMDLPSTGTARAFERRPTTAHHEPVKVNWVGTIKALLAVLYVGGMTAGVVVYAFGLPDAARDARTLVRRGQAVQIVPQLERYVNGPKPLPDLEAALGYAQVYAKKPLKALDAYQAAAEHDPAALEAADIAAVAGMLALSTNRTFDAEKILKRVGARATPWLEEIWGRDKVDQYIRCRAGDVLASTGGSSVDFVSACAAALQTRRCSERKIVIQRLRDLHDPRAIPALHRIAIEPPIVAGEDCGNSAAADALVALGGGAKKHGSGR